jgi:hypothetical protein
LACADASPPLKSAGIFGTIATLLIVVLPKTPSLP